MKKLIIVPCGWSCTLDECPPGFFEYNDELCLKAVYGSFEAFCANGDAFWGGTSTKKERDNLIVQPVEARWVEE